MVTSKVVISDFIKKEIPFPKIMKHKNRELYVLIAESGIGTIIGCEVQDKEEHIGLQAYINMEYFEDYEGYIILSNMDSLSKGTL